MMANSPRIGIIAEYNPFHNGHIYQLEWIRQRWPNCQIIVILSGNYVQRGELAVADFATRKQTCIAHGVHEVYELPFWYATQAAHIFAAGAVALAVKVQVDFLVFGAETNDIDRFYDLARAIYHDEARYYEQLRTELKQGVSFPRAHQLVLEALVGQSCVLPNDILGLEYVKAIVKHQYPITAVALQRTVSFTGVDSKRQIASATHIRELIFAGDLAYQRYTPMVFNAHPPRIEDYYPQFQRIITTTPVAKLRQIHLVSEGMEFLFQKHIHLPSYEAFVAACTSKRYPASRIKRVLLYVLLGIETAASVPRSLEKY